ncbi:MAG: hypothetical protein KC619_04705 [Myxococcales bacterium]|nr:hypothetical protein [Myxococcales bacterium]
MASHPDAEMSAPDLFLAGDRLGVLVFESNVVAHPIVTLGHADLALTEVTDLRRVGEESHGWGEAAWTGDAVGVCWNGDPGGMSALRFREIEGLDGPLGPRTDFAIEDGPCMDLVFAHGVYAMTWRYQHWDEDPARVESVFALMSRVGELVSERMTLTSTAYPGRTPSIEVTDEGFLVAVNTDTGVRIVEVDALGRIQSDRAVDLPEAGYSAVALRGDEVGLFSLVGPPEARALVFTIVGRDGRVRHERRLEDGAPTTSYPRLVARPEGWALLWSQGSRPSERALILSVDPDGVPIAPRRVFYEGRHSSYGGPSLLSRGDSLYVAYAHPQADDPPYGRDAMYVERWDCTGAAVDLCRSQEAQAGDCDGDDVLGWRWDGEQCEAVIGCASDCVGADCGGLAITRFACESDRTECPRALECAPAAVTPSALCIPTEVTAGRATRFRFEAWIDACPCVPGPTCRVTPTESLELTVSLETCGDMAPECDCAPLPPVRRPIDCVLPPLAPGEWTVRGPDEASLGLLVRPSWEAAEPEETCHVW